MSSTPSDTNLILPLNHEYPRLPPELVREVLQYQYTQSGSFLDLFSSSLVCATWYNEACKLLNEDEVSDLLCGYTMTADDISRTAELLKEAHKCRLHYLALVKNMDIVTFQGESDLRQALEGYAAILALRPPNLPLITIQMDMSDSDIYAFFDHIKTITLPAITGIGIYVSDTQDVTASYHPVTRFISSQSATLTRFFIDAIHYIEPINSVLPVCNQLRMLSLCLIDDDELLSLIPSLPELRILQYYRDEIYPSPTEVADELRKWCPHVKEFQYTLVKGYSWITVSVHERRPRDNFTDSDEHIESDEDSESDELNEMDIISDRLYASYFCVC